jgi:hypothetical protein
MALNYLTSIERYGSGLRTIRVTRGWFTGTTVSITFLSGATVQVLQLVDWVYEQRIPPWQPYFGLLDRIHQHLVPKTYAEIGVSLGRSLTLTLPGTVAVGIDPLPNLKFPLRRGTRVFSQTSDDFFAQHDLRELFGGRPLHLGFIDGMHRFEFALRDFINLERASSSDTVLLIHDCLPIDELSAEREQLTEIWSGDVWRLILILKEWRPELDIAVVDIAPTGLGVVQGLDPHSVVLQDNYDDIVSNFMDTPFSVLDDSKHSKLGTIPSDWPTVRAQLPSTPYRRSNVEVLKAQRATCGVIPLAQRSVNWVTSRANSVNWVTSRAKRS